jgi:poly(3-hydroxybutyrate) depolymerase
MATLGGSLIAVALCAVLAGFVGAASAQTPQAIPEGAAERSATIDGVTLQVFTYRPGGCAVSGILLVFHGSSRNADGYRDHAAVLGRQLCRLVVAPRFDKERFPRWRYQRGGIVLDGAVQPADRWTVGMVPKLVAWARAQESAPDMPYALIGHSAGAQFLGRVAAFVPLQATRIVIANPSTWVLPTLDVKAPYGLGGVYDAAQGQAALRRYLAEPITVLLGQDDTGSHELADNAEAVAEGPTRLARGQNTFRQAEATARAHGWTFGWELAIVPGVGHSAAGMFASAQALDALRR